MKNLAILCASLLVTLASCTSGQTRPSPETQKDPESAAQLAGIYTRYLRAVASGDLEAALLMVPSGKRAYLRTLEGDALAPLHVLSPTNLEYHDGRIIGDEAFVVMFGRVGDNYGAGTIQMVREEGEWKVLTEMWNVTGEPSTAADVIQLEPTPPGLTLSQQKARRAVIERGYPLVNDDAFVSNVRNRDLEIVKLFLEAGISINAQANGTTALLQASDLENPEIALYLIERGADVNAADQFGRTPLIMAAANCAMTPVVAALIRKGANPSTKPLAGGLDAREMAKISRCEESLKLIDKAR